MKLGPFDNVRDVDDEEAEKAQALLCLPLGPSRFTDNLTGPCADCGRTLMFRPYSPKTPPKLCPECLIARLDAQESS